MQVDASKEIILSAGVIGTPKILLLSGIGPERALQEMGLPSIVDLPVGHNLTDQPLVPSYFFVNSTKTFDDMLRNATLAGEDLELWNTTGQGLLVDSSSNTQGFMRLPKDSPIFKKFKDPSSGPLSGHTELIFAVSVYIALPCMGPIHGYYGQHSFSDWFRTVLHLSERWSSLQQDTT